MRRSFAPVLLTLLLASCVAAPPVVPEPETQADFLRARMAEADDDLARSFVRDELAKVEFERARAANTIYAYRHFLAEFPGGREATAARALLEELRFAQAEEEGTIEAWRVFLEETPRGRRTAEARHRLGTLEIRQALSSSDAAHVARILARYPDHPDRAGLADHEDELAWAMAREGDLETVRQYLSSRPEGRHRAEALRLSRSLQREELLRTEDLPQAVRQASSGGADPDDLAAVAELRLRLARRELDLEALRNLAGSAEAKAAQSVLERVLFSVNELSRPPMSPETRAAVDRAREGFGLRPRDELVRQLRDFDPLVRAEAVRELGEWGGPASVEPILSAVTSRYLGVQLAAIDALEATAASMAPPVWTALARRWEEELVARGLDASAWRQVAALREASGDLPGALVAWREVTRAEPDDPAGAVRVLVLERRRGDRLAVGAAARELSRTASLFTDGRWLSPPEEERVAELRRGGKGVLVGPPAELTVLRQICAGSDAGDLAAEALHDLRTGAAAGEQDLLGLASNEIERTLVRVKAKRAELEEQLRRRLPSYIPCSTDRSAARIEASREVRATALRRLGQLGDRRVRPFVEARLHSPSERVRDAARDALELLAAP